MNEKSLHEQYEEAIGISKLIYDELIGYYGENRVDVSYTDKEIFFENSESFKTRFTIWFPEITVTNENNKSIDIKDLFVLFTVQDNGTITGDLRGLRGTYTYSQYNVGYMHSHLRRMNKNEVSHPRNFCLGSSPLSDTYTLLSSGFDIHTWAIFCIQLDIYVTVESLKGVPYIKMEEVFKKEKGPNEYLTPHVISDLVFMKYRDFFFDFIDYLFRLCRDKCLFRVDYPDINIGMQYLPWRIFVTEHLFEFAEKRMSEYQILDVHTDILISEKILNKYIISGNDIYIAGEENKELFECPDQQVLVFKSKSIRLRVIPDTSNNENEVLLINDYALQRITSNLLLITNFCYRHE